MLVAGSRVIRGPGWKGGDEDGGEGHLGTVTGTAGACSNLDTQVEVCWDNGKTSICSIEDTVEPELVIYDNGQTGIRHEGIKCNACGEPSITGVRRECMDCGFPFNLCNSCYHGDHHNLGHTFRCYSLPGNDNGIKMESREDVKKERLFGISYGAHVETDQKTHGCVVDIVNLIDTVRSAVVVEWPNGEKNTYKLGHHGVTEVKLEENEDVDVRLVYTRHLPALTSPPRPKFQHGQIVQVTKNVEFFKHFQQSLGLWQDGMEKFCGRTGCISQVRDREGFTYLAVFFHDKTSIPVNPDCLETVSQYDNLSNICDAHNFRRTPIITELAPDDSTEEYGDSERHSSDFQSSVHQSDQSKSEKGSDKDDSIEVYSQKSISTKECAEDQIVTSDGEVIHFGDNVPTKPNSTGVLTSSTVKSDDGVSVESTNRCSEEPKPLKKGDYVRVKDLPINEMKSLQEGHGKYVSLMRMARGSIGKVKLVYPDRDVRIKSQGFPTWTYNPACLVRVEDVEMKTVAKEDSSALYKRGEIFLIRGDLTEEDMKKYQEDSGGWNAMMTEIRGKPCIVKQVEVSRIIVTMLDGEEWAINPLLLTKEGVEGVSFETESHFRKGDKVRVRQMEIEEMKRLQLGNGGWATELPTFMDKTGVITKIKMGRVMKVKMDNGMTAQFHRSCLILIESAPRKDSHKEDSSSDDDSSDDETISSLSKALLEPLVKLKELGDQLGIKLDNDGNSSSVTDKGPSQLLEAITQGSRDKVEFFLAQRPQWVDYLSEDGISTPLINASVHGYRGIVKLLLAKGANADQGNVRQGLTPLISAAYHDRPEIVEILLDHGADINKADDDGDTPIFLAVGRKNYDSVMALLKPKYKCDVQRRNKKDQCATEAAIIVNDIPSEVGAAILNSESFQPSQTDKNGFNSLHLAAKQGKTWAVKIILEKAPDIVNIKKDDGWTALHLAAGNDNVDTIAFILDQKRCEIDVRNNDGETPLHRAVSEGHINIVEKLLDMGADINAMDKDGDTSLHLACIRSSVTTGVTGLEQLFSTQLELLRQLADVKSSPVGSTENGNKHIAIAIELLQRGARVDILNHHGQTAFGLLTSPQVKMQLQEIASSTFREKHTAHARCKVGEFCITSTETIDHKGGNISLPNADVAVKIPQDALEHSVSLSVMVDPCEHHPVLEKDQLILGPVISCKPDGMVFLRPVTISVPHSGYNLTTKCIQIWCKNGSATEPNAWEKVYDGSIGYAKDDTSVIVERNRIKVRMHHFSLYDFVTAPLATITGWVWPGLILDVFAYMYPVNVVTSKTVRLVVYAVKKEDEACRRMVAAKERKNMSAECCTQWSFVLKQNGNNLKVTAKNIQPAQKWLSEDKATKEILYAHIQAGGIGSRCEIKFRQNDDVEQPDCFEGAFQTDQAGNSDSVDTIYFDDKTAKCNARIENPGALQNDQVDPPEPTMEENNDESRGASARSALEELSHRETTLGANTTQMVSKERPQSQGASTAAATANPEFTSIFESTGMSYSRSSSSTLGDCGPFLKKVARTIEPRWKEVAQMLDFTGEQCDEFESTWCMDTWWPAYKMLLAWQTKMPQCEFRQLKHILADAVRPIDIQFAELIEN